jgi:alanyl-tRNA synthetase
VRVIGAERYKGMTRVTFTAGRKARAELFSRDQVLRGLAAQFSCGPAEVPAAIDKMRRDIESSSTELTTLRSRLASAIVDAIPGTGAAVASIPGDAELLRSVAAKLVAAGRDAILCAPEGEGAVVVLFRAAGSTLDCGALWKKIVSRAPGRGGGRAERAEGRLTSPIPNWAEFIDQLA